MPFVSGVYSLPAGYDIPIVANSALGMRWSYDTMHDIEQSISGIITAQTLNASPASGDFLLSEVAAGTSLQKVTIGSMATGINHDALAGLQGGTAGQFFHLTSAEYTGSGTGVFARTVAPVFTTPNIGTATGSVSGNAGSATVAVALQTPRAINGVNFDGTAPITVTADASTLTGTTLAAGVTASSLITVGTLTTLGLGIAPNAVVRLTIGGTTPAAAASYSVYNQSVLSSVATGSGRMYESQPSTTAAAFTCTDFYHFLCHGASIGAGSAITNQYGYYVDALITGVNNYGFYANTNAAANRWNLYMVGTADNAVAGNFRIGSTTAPTVALDVTGAAKISTTLAVTGIATYTANIVPAANGVPALGAANVGWKGVYLDYTNTGTVGAVTINKPAGRVNIAATGTSVVVTNSIVTAASHVFVQKSESTSTGGVVANVVPGAGSFTINVTAVVGATASYDFLVINAD